MENIDNNLKVTKIRKSKTFKLIKNSLLSQLENKNENFIDLVNDYMNFYITKQLLNEDIEERGVTIYYKNREGCSMSKKNDSVGELTKINMQMLKILIQLDIKAKIEDKPIKAEMVEDVDEL